MPKDVDNGRSGDIGSKSPCLSIGKSPSFVREDFQGTRLEMMRLCPESFPERPGPEYNPFIDNWESAREWHKCLYTTNKRKLDITSDDDEPSPKRRYLALAAFNNTPEWDKARGFRLNKRDPG